MTVTIRGLAYRAGSARGEYPATWVVPQEVFLHADFNIAQQPIGKAALTQRPGGSVEAKVSIPDDLARHLIDHPYFVVGVRSRMGLRDWHGAEVACLSIAESNVDSKLPPYRITSIPDDIPYRVDILRGYREVTVVDDGKITALSLMPDGRIEPDLAVTKSHIEWEYAGALP